MLRSIQDRAVMSAGTGGFGKAEPPEDLVRAMNLQMTAGRERRTPATRAEGDRAAAIQRAGGEKAALVRAAEGRQQDAPHDAEAREKLAEAEARATEMVARAAAGFGGAALRCFTADRYVRAFEGLASNLSSMRVAVPVETGVLAGAAAGAVEPLRGGTGPRPGGGPRPSPSPASVPGDGPWNRG